MQAKKILNLFDILGYLCALFTKEKERECSINWSTARERDIKNAIIKYDEIVTKVLKISSDPFNIEEVSYFTEFINKIYEEYGQGKLNYEQIYLLIIHIENSMVEYFDRQGGGVIHEMKPLNSNYDEVNIAFYPFYNPKWGQGKSERHRSNTFNAKFQHYFMLRKEDASPFQLVFHYWNDEGVLSKISGGWNFRVAMSPVMDSARLKMDEGNNGSGNVAAINGILNEEEVNARVERIFENIMERDYGIVVFPEALGSENITSYVTKKMQRNPEFNSFVLLPTMCSEKKNRLVILGPGGIEVFRKEKSTAFILRGSNGETCREQLDYTNRIDLLITRELGIVAFLICAEMLEPEYFSTLLEVAKVDFIVCASFSPGYQAFRDTMKKGEASQICCLWINTCSAKNVSANGKVPEILAAVQVPERGESITEIKTICGFCCSEEMCYFDILIEYVSGRFCVNYEHVIHA